MTKINKRRDFVKLLTLAGLGLYLPACELDGQKKIDNSKNQIEIILEQQ